MSPRPDAALVLSFGGPEGPEDVRPFLARVVRGRPVPQSRIDEVARHYDAIGGRSPLAELTRRQADALRAALARAGCPIPVRVGMRYARPFVAEALRELVAEGAREVVCAVMVALLDRETMARYAEAVEEARRAIGEPALQLRYAASVGEHAGFVRANAEHLRAALAGVPRGLREAARVVFTAHSVPTAIGESSGYVALYERAAELIARELGLADYQLAYQSRGGSSREPWLQPDVRDVIRSLAAAGARAVVVLPVGFVCDHVEVLYDLDIDAAQVAREAGVLWRRASTVDSHPAYIEALRDSVYGGSRADVL